MQLYLDLDGVFTDFKKTYFVLLEKYKKDKKDNWEFFSKMVLEKEIFKTLEPLPNAFELYYFVDNLYASGILTKKPKFLTSVADNSGVTHALQAKEQKTFWVRTVLQSDYEVITVTAKKYKKDYATPDSFLLDDTLSNIVDFTNAGGSAFHYSDSLINEAKKSIVEWVSFTTKKDTLCSI